MDKHRLLWALVIANVLLAFASVGAEAFFGWTLPGVLSDYEHARFSGFLDQGAFAIFRFLILATGSLCALVAWVGLLAYRPFARRLLLISLGLTLLHVLFAGPSVRTSIGAMFSIMDFVVSGALLGLVYFSELAKRFEPGQPDARSAARRESRFGDRDHGVASLPSA